MSTEQKWVRTEIRAERLGWWPTVRKWRAERVRVYMSPHGPMIITRVLASARGRTRRTAVKKLSYRTEDERPGGFGYNNRPHREH